MKFQSKTLAVILLCITAISACKKDKLPDTTGKTPDGKVAYRPYLMI